MVTSLQIFLAGIIAGGVAATAGWWTGTSTIRAWWAHRGTHAPVAHSIGQTMPLVRASGAAERQCTADTGPWRHACILDASHATAPRDTPDGARPAHMCRCGTWWWQS